MHTAEKGEHCSMSIHHHHHHISQPSLSRAVLCEADRATPLLHSSSLSAPTKLCRRPYNEISYFFSRFGAIFDWTGGTLFTSTKKSKQSEACLKGKASQLPSAAPSAPYRGRSNFTQVFKVRRFPAFLIVQD
ncbi:hypothetical protein AOLI_G00061470 [Acnodon oligacanthus]